MQQIFRKHVVIYESSSFGGCYEYALQLFNAFKQTEIRTTLILPSNSLDIPEGASNFLLADKSASTSNFLSKVYFLIRQLVNPLLLFFYLIRKKDCQVIFNDFEQLTTPIWIPLFKIFLSRKHTFSIILHDPDRDNYPPSKAFSNYCMKLLMGLMDVAFYHGYLPSKPYYRRSITKYVEIPHGIYPLPKPDLKVKKAILDRKISGHKYLSILGNIREEKNYALAIRALPSLPECLLIIAGAPANSRVNTDWYKNLADELGVSQRIIWHERYLSEKEMASVIDVSDIILLNYSNSFASQSGIINMIAPFKKNILVSKTTSSLTLIVEKFQLGDLIEPDNLEALINGIKNSILENSQNIPRWDLYLQHSSWASSVLIMVNSLNSVNSKL